VRAFSAGSLIIPMDSCYQPAGDTVKPTGCAYTRAGTDGPVKAYGLVYLLLKRGITVYVATNPDKARVEGVDFSIRHAGAGPPVGLYDRTTRAAVNFTTASELSYLGAPFLIDVSEASTVLSLLQSDATISAFTSVAIHIAYDNFQAPIGMRMNGVPPRVAVFTPPSGKGGSVGTEGIPLMRAYLRRAGLDYTAAMGTPAAPGEIFDVVTSADVLAGALSASYQVVWLPHYDAYQSSDQPILSQIAAFADRGGMVFAECASIYYFEAYGPTRFMTPSGIQNNQLAQCYPGNTNGWNRRGTNPGNAYRLCFDPVQPEVKSAGADLEFPFPANAFVQIGDYRFYKHWGAVEDFVPSSGAAWRTGVQHLLRSNDTTASRDNRDILALTYKDNDTNKGQIIYFGGHFYGDATGAQTAGIRIVLNTLLFARPTLGNRYLSRSSPVILTDSGRTLLMQGTYLENNTTLPAYSRAADAATWVFPQVLGRYQAYDITGITSGGQSLSIGTGAIWDASVLMPAAGARRLYTSQGNGDAAALIDLTTTGIAALGSNPFGLPTGFTSGDTQALLNRIRGAQLGGIDHSTSAVIGPQALVPGGATRPTVAYVGALDGMLHAFAVSGGSATPGTELWGFLPGDLLASVRVNGAALDGSPNVGDIFENIGGVRRWRTLLTIPQGRLGSLIYGLDISDPNAPALLWQQGNTQSEVVLGSAAGAAMTILPTSTNPFQSFVVVASSTPGGPPGLTVTALSGDRGSQLWRWSTSYSRTLPGTPAVVPNDMPATAAIGGTTERYDDRVYVADLEGRIWELETSTGRNVNGSAPLADVGLTPGGRVQPIGVRPALYIDRATGHRALVVVTGGADWAYPSDTYAVYAFDLDPSARQADTGAGVARRLFRTALAAGLRGYAPPTVSGNEIFVLGGSGVMGGAIGASVSDSATLYRINLSGGAVTATQAMTKGAGAFVGTSDGTIYGATARDLMKFTPGNSDRSGQALRNVSTTPLRQRIWLEVN
jgi:hypothetical protein